MSAKEQTIQNQIEFRHSEPSEAKIASRLLFESNPRMATFMIGLGSELRAKSILAKIFSTPGHRLSYQFTEMVVQKSQVVGLCTFFPGRHLSKLNRRLSVILLRHYHLRGKVALILRGFPLIFIKEAARDELFVSNLVLKKRARNQGVGTHIVNHLEAKARDLGLDKVSLMINIDNREARQFLEHHGFKVEALHLESNKRISYLGTGYLRMVKKV